jgi:hypothetical protein
MKRRRESQKGTTNAGRHHFGAEGATEFKLELDAATIAASGQKSLECPGQ